MRFLAGIMGFLTAIFLTTINSSRIPTKMHTPVITIKIASKRKIDKTGSNYAKILTKIFGHLLNFSWWYIGGSFEISWLQGLFRGQGIDSAHLVVVASSCFAIDRTPAAGIQRNHRFTLVINKATLVTSITPARISGTFRHADIIFTNTVFQTFRPIWHWFSRWTFRTRSITECPTQTVGNVCLQTKGVGFFQLTITIAATCLQWVTLGRLIQEAFVLSSSIRIANEGRITAFVILFR